MYNSGYFKHYDYIEWTDTSYMSAESIDIPNLVSTPYNNEYDEPIIDSHFSKILAVNNESTADHFVSVLRQLFSASEIVKLYYNISNRDTKKYRQVSRAAKKSTQAQTGGKLPIGPELTDDEIKIYRFLLIFDTIHDFNENKAVDGNENIIVNDDDGYIDEIKEFINANKHLFPLVTDAETLELVPMPIKLVENEEGAIYALSVMPKLRFLDGSSVDNPFYKLDISTLDIYRQVLPITYKQFLIKCINKNTHQSYKRSFSVELFGSSADNLDKSILKLEANGLLRLLYYINTMTNYARLDFQLDNVNEPFCKLLFSLGYIQDAIEKLFIIDPEIVEYLENNQIGYMDNKPWFAAYSDTNLFDPSITFTEPKNKGIELYMRDDRPTGSIYNTIVCPYQVYLDGAKYNNKQPRKSKVNTNVTIMEDQTDDTFLVYDELSQATFSTNSIKKIINFASIFQLNNTKPKNTKTIDSKLVSYSIEMLLALKRAGDWGQVEHCKKYNKIFVTSDRYAALYAYFRKVPTILVRKQSTLRDHQLEQMNVVDISEYREFTKFSFIILNPNK